MCLISPTLPTVAVPVANVGGGLSVMTVDEYETAVEFSDQLMELDESVNVTTRGVCVLLCIVVC